MTSHQDRLLRFSRIQNRAGILSHAPAEMLAATKPLIEAVLHHDREASYLPAIAEGKYQPELLFPEQPEIVKRIRQHPALIWKAENVARHLIKSKKP